MGFAWVSLFGALLLVNSLPFTAFGQVGQDCSDPIVLGEDAPDQFDVMLNTRDWENSTERTAECFEGRTTGPDVVLRILGEVEGTIEWTADFDACVYLVADSCDAACVVGALGSTGSLSFGAMMGGGVSLFDPYIIVDGVGGASGTISIDVSRSVITPILTTSWGALKRRYRAEP